MDSLFEKWSAILRAYKRAFSHLIQHCSFIAHFNRAEFYSYYFESGSSVALFLSQFDARGPFNGAMIGEATRVIPSLVEKAHQEQKMKDVQAATALLEKDGLVREDRTKVKDDASSCKEKAKTKNQDRLTN